MTIDKRHFKAYYAALNYLEKPVMPNNATVVRSLPDAVRTRLRELGKQLSVARKRRRQTQRELAARMNVDVRTLRRLEGGDPGVSLGVYAAALWTLGMLEKLIEPTTPGADELATTLDISELPKRVRRPRPKF